MIKRIKQISFICMIIILMMGMCICASAEVASGACGDNVTWTLDDEGTLKVSGEGAMKGYSLSGGPWKSYSAQIKKLVVEEGVTTVGAYAFLGLKSLTDVSLPESIVTIEKWAFQASSAIKEIVIPSSVTSIGDYAFYSCSSLKKITIPPSVTTVGSYNLEQSPIIVGYENSYAEVLAATRSLAFESLGKVSGEIVSSGTLSDTVSWSVDTYNHLVISGSGSMPDYTSSSSNRAPWYDLRETVTKITVGEGITTVGTYAFYKMEAVVVKLPETLTALKNYAFYMCYDIDKIYMPPALTSIGTNVIFPADPTVTGYTYSYAQEFAVQQGWKFVSLGDMPYQIYAQGELDGGLTWSFDNRLVLNISGSGSMIDFASEKDVPWYSYRSRVKSLNIGEGVLTIGAYAFASIEKVTEVSLPEAVGKIGDYAFYYCTNLAKVNLNGVIESVGNYAFYECRNITKLIFKDGLKSIGDCAFTSIISLGTVEVGNSLETIGKSAFNQTALSSLTLPDTVVSIGEGAFIQTKFSTFTIPPKMTAVPASLFENASLSTIIFHDNVTSIGAKAFYQTRINSLSLPKSLKTIGESAFYRCSLTEVVIPEGVEAIGAAAFSSCSSLALVTISSTVTSIGGGAFKRCNLTEIVFPDSVETLGTGVVEECTSLTSVKLPANITRIPSYMFSGCTSLTEVDIPQGVTSIGMYAFEEAMTGGKITLPDSVTEICERAFFNCGATEIIMSKNVASIGEYAFSGSKFKSITVPGKVVVLGAESLRGGAFETVVLEEGITTINNNALYGLTKVTSISLPSTLKVINGSAFASSAFTEITLPEGLEKINSTAFSSCKNLTTIYAPKSLTYIYSSAFKTGGGNLVVKGYTGSVAEYNYKLYGSEYSFGFEAVGAMEEGVVIASGTDANIQWKVTTPGVLTISGSGVTVQYSSSKAIPWNYYAKYIETLVVEEGINYLSDWQEEKHTNLKEIITHYSLIGIYDNFDGVVTTPVVKGYTNSAAHNAATRCSFEFVSLGEAVDEVVYKGKCGEDATWGITTFGKLIISGTGSVDNMNYYTVPWKAYYKVLKELEICDGITSVPSEGYSDFYNFAFDKVTVSHTVESFYPNQLKEGTKIYAYNYSPAAESANKAGIEYISLGDAPKKVIESGTFGENITWAYDNYRNLVLEGFGDMPYEDVPWRLLNTKIDNVQMSSSITSIAPGAFKETNITSFVIPEGVTTIETAAFQGCSLLTSITFPYSIVTVTKDAFWSAPAINSVTGYEESFAERFAAMRSIKLTSLGRIPEKVEITGVASDTISYTVDNYGTITFTGTGMLPDREISYYNDLSYERSPWYLDMGISAIKLVIGEGITRVGRCNFSSTALTEIILPESLESVGIYAFSGTEISEIVIPENVVSVGYKTFMNCRKLQTVWFEGNIEAISQELFANTTLLKRIQIPATVTTIYADAFNNSGIEYIYYGGTTTSWQNNVTGKEYIPDGVTILYAKQIPEEATYTVTKIAPFTNRVEVTLSLNLMGGEGLYVVGYNAEGTMVDAKRVSYATGSRKITIYGNIKTVKILFWENESSMLPIGEVYENTVK